MRIHRLRARARRLVERLTVDGDGELKAFRCVPQIVGATPLTRRALVCGAGGFVGGHLVERLKAEGYWVRGADVKRPEFRDIGADEFAVVDLRDRRLRTGARR